MHEASLVQGLLDMCLTAVREHNAAHPEAPVTRVEEVRCQLGLLSCVEPQTLTACFELFTEDTPAAGARLVLETAPLSCRCQTCGHDFTLTPRRFTCPRCGGENIHCDGGHGLTLLALHVAAEEPDHD